MEVTLIIPCFNEEVNLQKGVLDRVGNYTKDHKKIKEVIVVDDGSTDSTKQIIKKKYLGAFPHFRLIENEHHGKALAIMARVENSANEFIMFSDMDLATPLEESEKILKGLEEGYDIVIGSRAQKREGAPAARKMQTAGFTIL